MTSCQGGAGTGTLYTYAQLEGLWINAGGPKVVAPIAAAIAEAESRGCTAALNPTDNNGTQTSVGLWQISNGTHQYPQSWLTAGGNASAAVAKYQGAGNSFAPWGTYASGAYTAFLNGSSSPDLNVPSGGGGGTDTATLTSAKADPGCALSIGGQHLSLLFGHGPSLPSACLIRKSEIRAVIGGLILSWSAAIGLVGAVILAASAFQRTGALSKAADAAAVIPGAGGVAAGLATAHSRATRTGTQARQQRASRETDVKSSVA